MLYYKMIIFVLLVIAQSGILYAETDKGGDRNAGITKEQVQNMKHNLTNPRTVPIIISGTVVDRQGNPVPGVKMKVEEIRAVPGTLENKRTRRHQTVDGAFEVNCQDCSDVRLRFRADGFYPKKVAFQLTEAETMAFMSGRDGDGFRIVRQGLVVQLEESFNPVMLHHVDATLDFGRVGALRVLSFDAGRSQITIKREVLKKRGLSAKDVPSMISLEAPVSRLDEIVRLLQNYPPDAASPINIYLDFSGLQTGVLPMEVSAPDKPKKAYRELIEAPEDGYANHLILNPDPKYNKGLYFYCRLGELFGKGRVSLLSPGYDRNSARTLEVGITIYFNPDGSRNLDALDH